MSESRRFSDSIGVNTTRMWAELENFERSKAEIKANLSDTEKELNRRIEKAVEVSRQQAEILNALVGRLENGEYRLKILEERAMKTHGALFGTDAGNEGLLVQFRIAQRVAKAIRWTSWALIVVAVFALDHSWIKLGG